MTIIHRILTSSLLVLALLCSNLSLNAQTGGQPEQGQIPPHPPRLPEGVIPAFPGAWGGGMFTSGGRGGKVIAVTNLNDSGEGSLRAALEAEGPRIVIFRVAGTIKVNGDLNINHPDITVAGQTAPGDGICIAGTFNINTHNVIVRHIRVRRGVPMGGDLQAAPAGKAPTFLFAALKDPQGANLDAAQIIKGWVDAKGESHERIFNVAWSEQGTRKEVDGRLPPVGNTVDLATATYQNSIGATELVGSFTDPQFDPAQRAYYYLRAVEIPTPRWTAYDSVRYKVQMTPDVPMTEQERVVTSPIWYNPG